MCPGAPDNPSGLHDSPWWQSGSPLNPLWAVQLLQGGVMWLRWEVKSQHSSSETLIKRCLHLSLSDPDLSAGHQEKKPERWGGEHGTRSRSIQPCCKHCHLFLHVLGKLVQQKAEMRDSHYPSTTSVRCERCSVNFYSSEHSVIIWALVKFPCWFI